MKYYIFVPLCMLASGIVLAEPPEVSGDVFAEQPGYSGRGHKAVLGVGAAIVHFDTKYKFTDKTSGRSVFIDPEGNLGLPEISRVTTIYGAYSFNAKHSIGFGYFGVNRESTLISVDRNFDDVLLVEGSASIVDRTRFYNITYGYKLFQDARSYVTLIAGINAMDLKYEFRASGTIEVNEGSGVRSESDSVYEEASVFAPLPLLGLDFFFRFTPKWGVGTKVSMVGGSYEDVSAFVLQSSINARYWMSESVGLLLGLSYFDAAVDIEDAAELTEIDYGYNGGMIGLHFGF